MQEKDVFILNNVYDSITHYDLNNKHTWVIPELENIWASNFLKNKSSLFWFSATYSPMFDNKLSKPWLAQLRDQFYIFVNDLCRETGLRVLSNVFFLSGVEDSCLERKKKKYKNNPYSDNKHNMAAWGILRHSVKCGTHVSWIINIISNIKRQEWNK